MGRHRSVNFVSSPAWGYQCWQCGLTCTTGRGRMRECVVIPLLQQWVSPYTLDRVGTRMISSSAWTYRLLDWQGSDPHYGQRSAVIISLRSGLTPHVRQRVVTGALAVILCFRSGLTPWSRKKVGTAVLSSSALRSQCWQGDLTFSV